MQILSIKKPLGKDTNSLLFKFIWKKSKTTLIKRKVMSLAYSDGGLHAPNIELMSRSLKLARIVRLLKKEQAWEES